MFTFWYQDNISSITACSQIGSTEPGVKKDALENHYQMAHLNIIRKYSVLL